MIRNGPSLSLSQSTEAIGNNSDASPQVDTTIVAPGKDVQRSWEERKRLNEANARRFKAYQDSLDSLGDGSSSPMTQAANDGQDHQETEANRKKEGAKERPPAPSGSNAVGQRGLC